MKIKIEIDESLEPDELILKTLSINSHLEKIVDLIKQDSFNNNFFIVYLNDKAKILYFKDIVSISTEGNFIFAHTLKEKLLLKSRLYQLENQLKHTNIVRISNSELINLDMVVEFDFSFSGVISVSLKNGQKTFVSRRNMARIKNILGI